MKNCDIFSFQSPVFMILGSIINNNFTPTNPATRRKKGNLKKSKSGISNNVTGWIIWPHYFKRELMLH
jgi:hypothetical protein